MLVCDICGGQLVMDSSGEFALCEGCGMKYAKDTIRAKVDITENNSVLNTSEKREISNWKKLADNAYENSNYSEAYTYYCKLLEKDPEDWFSTYRKGMCIGWEASLNDMHIDEVVGGVLDANKLLYEDREQDKVLIANGILLMANELYNWINAINNLVAEHGSKYGTMLEDAAREFYREEQQISTLIQFNVNMLSEFVYEHYENKQSMEKLMNAMCNLGHVVIKNMQTSFQVKGQKWNSFWLMYEDTYESIEPDYSTLQSRLKLASELDDFEENIRVWKENYQQKIREQRKAEYWQMHADEKKQYESRIANIDKELDSLKLTLEEYNSRKDELCRRFSIPSPNENRLSELTSEKFALVKKQSALGLFARKQKKEIQLQIDALQIQIDDLELIVDDEKEKKKDEVTKSISELKERYKPIVEKESNLKEERRQIFEELTKER